MLENIRKFGHEVHIMLDLETMSAASNAAIVQIGAVAFRPLDPPGTFLREFCVGVSLKGQSKLGFDIDEGTIQWWMDIVQLQGVDVVRSVFDKSRQLPLTDALNQFRRFCEGRLAAPDGEVSLSKDPAQHLWGHGATFDCVILNNAYRAVGQRPPLDFRAARDTRTVFAMLGSDWSDLDWCGPKHDGLADAKRQTVVVQRVARQIWCAVSREPLI